MNVRQGSFRLWVLLSIIFVITLGTVSYDPVLTEFRGAASQFIDLYGALSDVPVSCLGGVARGEIGSDYYEKEGTCWYNLRVYRRLYPEEKGESDHDLEARLYKISQPPREFHPWQMVRAAVAIAFGGPLASLALGWGAFWAFAGFKEPKSQSRRKE